MSEKRATIEMIAPTVEEAIQKGIEELGLSRDDVETEILDEGNRGLFGLGSRQARVRLMVKPTPEEALPTEDTIAEKAETISEVGKTEKPVQPEREETEVAPDDEQTLNIARETVEELIEKMKVRAEVNAYFGEADDEDSLVPLHVDIHGDDLSYLIGRRAETLNALQYITGLIVGKELSRYVPIVVDVEGYRKRKERQLRQLAQRVAEQVVKTGRRQALEPMPANQRRIIHIELRDHPDVYTQSFGEPPRRKVNIIPKN